MMKNMQITLKHYKKELTSIEQELRELPSGSLAKKENSYYQTVEKKQTSITKNEPLIQQLSRKKYLTARKKQLTHNISMITNHLNKFDAASPKEIMASFSKTYQDLPEHYFFHPSIKDFLTKSYTKNPYQTENLAYTSNNGTPVRSKSEVLIANKLESYHIPYRYEIAITLGNKTIYPDFIIKNPFTGKTIIWEHFGALNQEGYEQKMTDKMERYLKHGYIPFETMIYTFEFDVKQPQRLQTLIQQIILLH